MREPLRIRLSGVAWLAAWRLARLFPERLVVRLFERLADRSWRRDARRRAIVTANLEPVVGPARIEGVVRDAFRSYARYWAETFRMGNLTDGEMHTRFRCEGRENIERAYAAGRGAVLATPHLGNWDAGGWWVATQWPLTAVAEVVRPRVLFERFVDQRRGLGITIVPLERGGDATGRCLERLAQGELVALVADRDLSGRGVEVRMFGRTARMPAGPAVLAQRSGAPLIPACIYMQPGGTWLARVLPAVEAPSADAGDPVRALTQRLADAFEELIAAEPAQWHAFSRYFE